MIDIASQLNVDRAAPATLAQQIREQLTWAISSGWLKPGDTLPSVREMGRRLGVNLHTVRAAYGQLEVDGLLDVRRGSATRVATFDPRRLWPPERVTRSHLVGVVVPTLASPFFAELLEGVEDAALGAGALVVVATTHDDQARALQAVGQVASRGADGVVVVSHDISALLAGPDGSIRDERWLPFVVVDRPGAPGHTVDVDLERVGHMATRHLIEHGHRAIGLLSIDKPPSNVVPLEAGYERALREAGIDADGRPIARVGAWDIPAGEAGATRLLVGPDRPTAVFAVSDLLAVGAIRTARRLGLGVPDDVAIIGVDDIPLLDVVNPPLTSVALPARAMGAEAMATLEHIWAGEASTPRRVQLPARLVIRESCGAHASR